MEIIVNAITTNDPLANPDQRAIIDNIIEINQARTGAAMIVLNELQSQIGYISEPMQQYVADQLHLPVSVVHGVVSFILFLLPLPAVNTLLNSAWVRLVMLAVSPN